MSLLGMLLQIGIAYWLSTNRKKINWKTVGWAFALQLIFAVCILKIPAGQTFFGWLDKGVTFILDSTTAGAEFVFGPLGVNGAMFGQTKVPHLFAFQTLPTIIFFSALMALFYHLGVMQKIVYWMAIAMKSILGTSGAETLSATSNIFVGQTEAPLMIKPYVEKMTMSELNAVMAGGMATIAGGVMAAYIGMLKDKIPGIAGHLIAASVMSAPASLMFSKIMVPETEIPETAAGVEFKSESLDSSAIDAVSRGCSEGLALALNVGAMLVGFISIIALANALTEGLFNMFGAENITLTKIAGWLFSPFAAFLGVPFKECAAAGQLLAEKTVLNEFVAYLNLANIMNGAVPFSHKAAVILSYALCGFSNLGSIGIQIGGIGSIAPSRRGDLAKLAVRALVAGTFASFMTANIAGLFIG
ncbi:MAG: NupC/NupG family nucleoside CNT transporter [Candidatus Riflebacteria bacterium]|nr:NupC/NupG family nucleoside CNT transporter [Candidatus Riflebacteria bacterium]